MTERGEPIIRPYQPADAARVKVITLEGFAPVSVEAAIDRLTTVTPTL